MDKWKLCSPYIYKIYIDTKGPNLKNLPELEGKNLWLRLFMFYLVYG